MKNRISRNKIVGHFERLGNKFSVVVFEDGKRIYTCGRCDTFRAFQEVVDATNRNRQVIVYYNIPVRLDMPHTIEEAHSEDREVYIWQPDWNEFD